MIIDMERRQKRCSMCKEVKDFKEYHKCRSKPGGCVSRCKICQSKTSRQRYASLTTKEKERCRDRVLLCMAKQRDRDPYRYAQSRRNIRLKNEHGIDNSVYVGMLEKQNNVCAICHKAETTVDNNGKSRALCIDHDHETGKIRQLLCHRCNSGIGLFKDNPELLKAAAEYLIKHVAMTTNVIALTGSK